VTACRLADLRAAMGLLKRARGADLQRLATLTLVCLAVVGSLVPRETTADHPGSAASKRLIRVEILAPPHVPRWYVAELARRMEAPLAGRQLPRSAAALLEVDRGGNIETLVMTETTGDGAADDALLGSLRQLAPFPVPVKNDYGTLRCVVRWSSL
jgi:hypothetical protein